jgi:cell wall-associated NlpC family hydrolase
MNAWAIQYIGEPWIAGENDCWAFARRVWREQFNITVPAVDVDAFNRLACSRAFHNHEERQHWYPVHAPRDGDAVLMGKNARPCHVGVWCEADRGLIVHCMEDWGVVAHTPTTLRGTGFRVLGYYRRCA